MKRRYFHLIILVITLLNACAPQAPAPHCGCHRNHVDGTASAMMSQTAAAYSPTPEATPVPQINGQTACYAGPGSNYPPDQQSPFDQEG
jgi:hypothetical protein